MKKEVITVVHFNLGTLSGLEQKVINGDSKTESQESELLRKPIIPNGALSIATVLKKNGFSVYFKDLQTQPISDDLSVAKLYNFLRDSSDILCIGCMCNTLPFLIAALKILKEEHPEKIIILGGPGPTDVCDALLTNFHLINVIVRGEGEATIVKLIDRIVKAQPLGELPGISYRHNKKVIHNPPQELIPDLSTIPPLDFSLLPDKSYGGHYFFTSRGCPYNCGYCGNVEFWRRKVRLRRLGDVFDEIEDAMSRFNLNALTAGDDTFFASNKNRITEFCKIYKERNLTFNWSAHHRIDLFDETTLQLIKKTNLKFILMGVDSGSNRVLRILNRNYTIQQAIKVVRDTNNFLSFFRISFIFGFPFETLVDFLNSLEVVLWLTKFRNIQIDIALLGPLRNTDIFTKFSEGLHLTDSMSEVAYIFFNNPSKGINAYRIIRPYQSILAVPFTVEDASVRSLVKDFPGSFPHYYNYKDPLLTLKLKILDEFVSLIEQKKQSRENVLRIEGNLIYFGKHGVRLLR